MSGSVQGGLIPNGDINTNQIINPSNNGQTQIHRDKAASNLGSYFGKLSDGTEEPIGSSGGLYSESGEAGIIAFPTGGFAGATQLTKRNNAVDVVGTDGDSVKVLPALPRLKQTIQNSDATESMDVFPGLLTDSFLGQAPGTPFSVAPGNQITVYRYENDAPGVLRLI